MTEPPGFHTKTLSPLSPIPVHPPEPENIPVLQNQTDPVFNLTSTHLEPTLPAAVALGATTTMTEAAPDAAFDQSERAPSSDSSFSDAYKEDANGKGAQHETDNQDTVSDYAMTFDSDGEAQSDSQDISEEIQKQDVEKSLDTPALPSSHTSNDIPAHSEAPSQVESAQANSSLYPPPSLDSLAVPPASISVDPSLTSTSQGHTLDGQKGEVDVQALLDNIIAKAELQEATTPTSAHPPPSASSSGLPAHASLPPRPSVRASYGDDRSNYHLGVQSLAQPANTYRPSADMPLVAAGAPGTSTDPRGGLPPPPSATFNGPPAPAGYTLSPAPGTSYSNVPQNQGAHSVPLYEDPGDADVRWPPEVQKKYDQFLVEERLCVSEGQWDRFPKDSRLFIGNLASEKVTKRDVYHIFHKYGKLAQIAIKQAYGFVQFHETGPCYAALDAENMADLRGKPMHLQIAKQQKPGKNANTAPVRRSRSPDRPRDRRGRGGRGGDHYETPPVRDEYGRILRGGRDDYRPPRSPSPPWTKIRDGYGPGRDSRDSYPGRDRRRSRSPSPPYGSRGNGRYRDRSPSPRRSSYQEEELQIPHRQPHEIPDVQVLQLSQLDRNFVSWIEGELRAKGLKVEVMFLSPRLSLDAVIKRQILEGVHAVSLLDGNCQQSSTMPLKLFDRQAGINNTRFEDYENLAPAIAAQLVLRAKSQAPPVYQVPHQQPVYQPPVLQQPQLQSAQSYYAPRPEVPVAPQYTHHQYQPDPPSQATPQNIAALVGQLDNSALQKLLDNMSSAPQQQNAPAVAANASIDLASLLGSLKSQVPTPQAYQQPAPYSNYGSGPSPLPANTNLQSSAAPPQQSAQQVQNIMAQLARFRQQ